MTEVWSCGGGTQSAAIAALIVQGRLPKPDRSVIADTGYERTSTWLYLDNVLRPALATVGVEVERVQSAEWASAAPSLLGAGRASTLLPVFHNGGRAPGYCSNEWKQRPLRRYLTATDTDGCRMWLGISTDEMRRVRTPDRLKWQLRYPLIFDVPLSRTNCVALVESMGWPAPPRSSCWMCPNHSDSEWRDIRDNWPEDWQRALSCEDGLRANDNLITLHRSGQPLASVAFSDDQQPDLFGCDGGLCYV